MAGLPRVADPATLARRRRRAPRRRPRGCRARRATAIASSSAHGRRVAEDVDRQDAGGALAERRLGGRRVEVQGDGIDVAEDRPGALVEEAVGGGDEAEGAGQDLVALAPAERPHARCRAAVPLETATASSTPSQSAKRALEALAHRPEREPARAQHLEDELLLARAEVWLREWDRLGLAVRSRREPPYPPLSALARGWKAYSSESTRASQEASMMFSETPIVPHSRSPSEESSRTRVTASVPWVSSRIRTL